MALGTGSGQNSCQMLPLKVKYGDDRSNWGHDLEHGVLFNLRFNVPLQHKHMHQ